MVDTKALRAFVGNDMRVRIPPRPLETPGCSSSVERSVWDREAGGSIPLTPTFRQAQCLRLVLLRLEKCPELAEGLKL